jgi:acyl carrier protein
MGTRERIQEIVRDALADDTITLGNGTAASDVPGWDSMANVTIVFCIEHEFGVRFDEDEFSGFANVGELGRMIERKLANAHGGVGA